MKKALLFLAAMTAVCTMRAQYMETRTLTAESGTIERLGEFYLPDSIITWNINTNTNKTIRFDYWVDLETVDALDELVIYEVNGDGIPGNPILTIYFAADSGSVTTTIPSGRAKIVLASLTGAITRYSGILIHYSVVDNDNVVENLYVSNRLGIGTTNPKESLHLTGNIRGGGTYGELTVKCNTGYLTMGSRSNMATFETDRSKYLFDKPIYLTSGVLSSSSTKNLTLQTNGTTRMTIDKSNGNVGIGTTTPKYPLDVVGTMRARAILISDSATTGADFVFAPEYHLPSLSEVDEFIHQNRHLPGILPASDMQREGFNMTELQIQLLQKIEELTLYLIEQEQTIHSLEEQVEKLKTESARP